MSGAKDDLFAGMQQPSQISVDGPDEFQANASSIEALCIEQPTTPKGLKTGLFSNGWQHLDQEAGRNRERRLSRILITVLAILCVVLLMSCIFLGSAVIKGSSSTSTRSAEGESDMKEVRRQQQIAATIMLSALGSAPAGGSEARALLRAAEIAESIGEPHLVMSSLTEAVTALSRSAFWPMEIRGHEARVTDVSLSPGGSAARLLATASEDGDIRVVPMGIRAGSGDLMPSADAKPTVLECPGGSVHSLEWSHDGSMLAAGCGTKDPQGRSTASVTVWQVGIASNEGVPRFTQRRSFPHGDTINALAWAPDGSAVAAGDDDGDLKIWILGEENASVDVDHPGSNDVRALSWSPDGKTLASGRTDERVFVWDVSELNAPILLSTGTGHNDDVNDIAFSPDGALLASAGDDGQVYLWDTAVLPLPGTTTLSVALALPESKGAASGVSWASPTEIAVSSYDGSVRVYDLTTRPESGRLRAELREEMRQPNVHFTSVSFVPGSPSMLAAGTHSTHAMAWRESEDLGAGFPESFELECSSRIREEYGEEDFSVRGATFADSGKRFAASTYEGYVCIWDRRESPAANGKLWQVVAAIQITGADKRNVPCRHLAFAPSGDLLAGATDRNGVHVWVRSPSTGIWALAGEHYHNARVESIDWSPNGLYLASASDDQSIGVWEVMRDGSVPILLNGHSDKVNAVAWRVSGNGGLMLASGASDATIRLWQLGIPSIGQIQVLGKFIIRDHNDDVQRLAWSSQGVLASGSATGVVLTHRVRHEGEDLEAQLVSTLDSKTGGELWGLSWKPDGTQVATANSDSTVRVWRHDGDGIGHRTWRVTEACTTLKWIDSQPERLACAREKSHPDIPSLHYNHFIQFILINFEDQLRLFERLTYGKLDGSDVAALGYQEVEDIVLGDP